MIMSDNVKQPSRLQMLNDPTCNLLDDLAVLRKAKGARQKKQGYSPMHQPK